MYPLELWTFKVSNDQTFVFERLEFFGRCSSGAAQVAANRWLFWPENKWVSLGDFTLLIGVVISLHIITGQVSRKAHLS